MSTALFNYTLQFHIMSCCNCGCPMALDTNMYNERLRDGQNFYCPRGHQQHFTETETAKLKKQIEQEQKRREWAERERDIIRRQRDSNERTARAYKGQLTKIKNRVSHGVCPCCNRTFQNLKAHMNTKHPDYKSE